MGFWLWLKRGNNRHRFHAMLLRVALIGPLICAINSARYLRTLSILQSSGVPLLDGMICPPKASTTSKFASAWQMRQKTFARVTAFIFHWNKPQFSADDALHGGLWRKKRATRHVNGQAADKQETLQQNRIALTLSIFEPALIITMALIVLFIVVSVLQPLLQLNSMIN
ncbi:hypothetical protein [Escherichia coli]|uniref:hypothetical protein n=1 Tax=Escherichia coli TaxID=562 RepID=UPI003D6515C0